MKEDLMNKIMEEVMRKMDQAESNPAPAPELKKTANITEFVGTAIGDTIGFVIANVDNQLHEAMKIDPKFRSIGIISARTGAGPQIFAADEAVKATNTEVVVCELARDTKGGAGHGSQIIFGAEDVSDARRAVEVALADLDRTFGDVYGNDAGHLEFQYTARASFACNMALGAPIGKAFGIIVGAPAGIGVLMSDAALKAANVELIGYASPGNGGTQYSNESMIFISGDAGAVRQALYAAREIGKPALEAMAGPAPSTTKPYI
ncbi:MAG: propanediol utilization microcompartment protein PduB [Eubacteriaceae bacterium]|jgi:microcompartment protein PduB|nr:propanediol utilization microcompartment protein PduB [Eubacteriaceae bacterium]